jgi:hypothetical protein
MKFARDVTDAEIGERRIAKRDGAGRELVFADASESAWR